MKCYACTFTSQCYLPCTVYYDDYISLYTKTYKYIQSGKYLLGDDGTTYNTHIPIIRHSTEYECTNYASKQVKKNDTYNEQYITCLLLNSGSTFL